MPRSWSGRIPSRRTTVTVVCYLVVSAIVLAPVLASPVLADDLFNPFGQFDVAGGGLPAALDYAWAGATEGSSFRIVGNPIGAAYNWLWLSVAARLGVSLTTFFAVTKFVVFVAVAASIAWSWQQLANLARRRPIAFRDAMIWVSLTLFSTVQIHAIWSNDPVANYPLAGYVPAALGFLVIGAAARLAVRRTWRAAGVATVAAVVAVTYYEMNIGAVMGATALLLASVVDDRQRQGRWHPGFIASSAVVPLVPACIVAYGRSVTGDQATTYAGTTVRLDGAPATFMRGVVSSLPGSSWRLSIDALGGQIGLVFFVFGTTLLVASAVRWWWAQPAAVPVDAISDPGPDPDPGSAPDGRGSLLLVVAAGIAVATYAAFSLALQSITVKVQDEAPAVGYVYTWFAMTSSAVALGLAVVGRQLLGRRPAGTVRFVVLALATSLLFVQNTVNWRLAEQLTTSYGANRRLIDAFDDAVPVADRCAALVQWTSIRWPGYYEDGIVDGLQESFEYYFSEPFCPFAEGDG